MPAYGKWNEGPGAAQLHRCSSTGNRSSNDDATMQENVKCAAFTNCALVMPATQCSKVQIR